MMADCMEAKLFNTCLFSDFSSSPVSRTGRCCCYTIPGFPETQKFREQNNEILETGLLTF
jgi:hypothetical protein